MSNRRKILYIRQYINTNHTIPTLGQNEFPEIIRFRNEVYIYLRLNYKFNQFGVKKEMNRIEIIFFNFYISITEFYYRCNLF